MKRLSLFLIISGIVMVMIGTGCSFFTRPKDNPVIEDQVGKWFNEKVGTIATDATRRTVVVNLQTREFCAEPSPDVAENITRQFALAIEAGVKAKEPVKVDAALRAASTLATAVQQLSRRTQGMQLFRDGMYNLCQGYVNKAINPEMYVEIFIQLLKTSATLVNQEIPRLTQQDYTRSELDKKSAADLKELFETIEEKNLEPKPIKEPELQDKPGTKKDEDTG